MAATMIATSSGQSNEWVRLAVQGAGHRVIGEGRNFITGSNKQTMADVPIPIFYTGC